jgi:hypothetical protein
LPTPWREAYDRLVNRPVTTTGGKIAATRHYFDSMTMMAQLGVVPTGAST